MTIRDLAHRLSVLPSLPPGQRSASAVGQAIDLRGYDGAAVIAAFGAWTDGSHVVSVQESSDGITWTDGDVSLTAIDSASGAGTVQTIGYRGAARYLRAVLTVTGATTGAASSVLVLRGYPAHGPI